MAQYGTWLGYGGTARLALAIVLLAAAGGATYSGIRLPLPLRPAKPGNAATIVMLTAWAVAIAAFLAGGGIYVHQAIHQHLAQAPPADPITPVTVGVGGIFGIILIAGSPGSLILPTRFRSR